LNAATGRLDAVVLEPAGDAQRSVIWLHGLGADGHDFVPLVEQLSLRCPTRFLFPHAPQRPVTVNGGLMMRAWYDILGLDGTAAEDESGIRSSGAAVQALIDAEVERGIAAERIVVAGFSQGGAVALHTALRAPHRLGGVIALSTYLPLAATLRSEASAANAGLDIFMAHGDGDPMIGMRWARLSRDRLLAAGYRVQWHRYAMGHEVSAQEVRDLDAWLNER
jgi:phospholipase/carboxylesterase